MNFNEYQEAALKSAVYPERGTGSKLALAYAIIGLGNEAGEAQGKIKKYLRGDFEWTKEKRLEALDEIADVLWYCAAAVDELGFDLDVAARRNIDKLQDRLNRGVIKGDGDKR